VNNGNGDDMEGDRCCRVVGSGLDARNDAAPAVGGCCAHKSTSTTSHQRLLDVRARHVDGGGDPDRITLLFIIVVMVMSCPVACSSLDLRFVAMGKNKMPMIFIILQI
jgi:hypothetical protein